MLKKKLAALILGVLIFSSNAFIQTSFVQAVTIQKQYINNNRSYEKLQPIGIVIHDTDEPGGTAQNNRDYVNRDANAKTSAHYFVDWDYVIQALPEDEVAWHAGYTANHKFLSVEMCVPYGQDTLKFNAVYKNTVDLVVAICKKYGWSSSNIYSHNWVSQAYHETDHTDPIGYLNQYGKSWDNMINDIQKEINSTSSNDNTNNNTNPAQNTSGSISELKSILTKNGYGKLNADNVIDSTTIAACPLLKSGSSGDVVKWIQSRLAISADGIFGAGTKQAVASFQKANGLEADGVIGKMTWTKLLGIANQNNSEGNTSNNTPAQNSSGDVAELQTILNKDRYSHLVVNNYPGVDTIAACPLLQVGSSGEVVKWVQKKLGINADGAFGNATKQAVINFQKANGLGADGAVGKMTWTKLLNLSNQNNGSTINSNTTDSNNQTTPTQNASGTIAELQTILNKAGYGKLTVDNQAGPATLTACPLLQVGSSGEVVKWVQKKLGVSADGIFGSGTKQAVINFQRANGLGTDGVIGKTTWVKLLGM
ncbi:peptidoglycan recognition protein family protein [Clostridium guangxiense]|uniref:peptidoglycan recognition protein family protein n=1 Tax=Clostridium guangxiense TaxID=1662055 RepID=UPI001E5B1EDA|nr:N-acetylmuramoyl-L-alanine amidase [Clostridium guangxiense]MCD2348363.1 N-acetylmuramoyl-L-alanine amidase [Clostridium guangxiense]